MPQPRRFHMILYTNKKAQQASLRYIERHTTILSVMHVRSWYCNNTIFGVIETIKNEFIAWLSHGSKGATIRSREQKLEERISYCIMEYELQQVSYESNISKIWWRGVSATAANENEDMQHTETRERCALRRWWLWCSKDQMHSSLPSPYLSRGCQCYGVSPSLERTSFY